MKLDLCLQVLDFIVRHFEFQLFSSVKLLSILKKISAVSKYRLTDRINRIGYNIAGLGFVLKEMSFTHIEDIDLP